MKLFIGTTLLLLLAGAPVFAGQEPDKDKPKEEPKKEEPKKQEEPKTAPKPAEKPKPEPAARPQDNDHPKPAQHQDTRAQDQQRAKQTEQHSVNNAQHGSGRRIPEEKFRASFGSEHHFHVQRGSNRFNYSGYWFVYNQPWPGDWDYNDDVYIEDVDGEYYLINPRHPEVRLIVVVGD